MTPTILTLLIIAAVLLAAYIALRFVFGYKRLIMIEEIECDKHECHHQKRNG